MTAMTFQDEECLSSSISQVPQDPGMHCLGYRGLVYIQILRWSQMPSLPMGRTSFPQSLPWCSGSGEMWEEHPVKTETKTAECLSLLHVISSPALFSGTVKHNFYLVFWLFAVFGFFKILYLSKPFWFLSHPLPNPAPTEPYCSWSQPYTTGQCPHILSRTHVPDSTVCIAFLCFILTSRSLLGHCSPALLASHKTIFILSDLITVNCTVSISLHTPCWCEPQYSHRETAFSSYTRKKNTGL